MLLAVEFKFSINILKEFLNIVGLDHTDSDTSFGDNHQVIAWFDTDQCPYILGYDNLRFWSDSNLAMDLHFKHVFTGHRISKSSKSWKSFTII
jgi:hypothetical protein